MRRQPPGFSRLCSLSPYPTLCLSWITDPVLVGCQQVGYITVVEENQAHDYDKITRSQNAGGYRSYVYTGKDAHSFLKGYWHDFNTDKVGVVLHERPSG